MGAQQSTGNAPDGAAAAPTKTCYYELLGVEQTAGDDEYVSGCLNHTAIYLTVPFFLE